MDPVLSIRLEKVASDCGFDQPAPAPEGWLGFASTQAPLRVWLTAHHTHLLIAAFSLESVARAVTDMGVRLTSPLPADAAAGLTVHDLPTLHRVLRRALPLARTLPTAPLEAFTAQVAHLSRTTEAERTVVQRVGQHLFRGALMEFWEGRCAVTGLAIPALLRASHCKPWAECPTDAERLDVFNGLLLAPHLDAVFDLGFLTVHDDGAIRCAGAFTGAAQQALGLHDRLRVVGLHVGHRPYLQYHRTFVFLDGPGR